MRGWSLTEIALAFRCLLTVTVYSVDRSPRVEYPAIFFHDLNKRILLGQLDRLDDDLVVDAHSRFAVFVVERAGRRVGWKRPALETLADWLYAQKADLLGPLLELRNTSMQALNR
jgi:hypothetical protein